MTDKSIFDLDLTEVEQLILEAQIHDKSSHMESIGDREERCRQREYGFEKRRKARKRVMEE